ncbi:DUF533 domain-containing protein [uncultured Roseobacter sp.]|uniref:DUF533 domain-containing protein n=1 Tax=uncultured Roseobacter sp. TaxID=114847 RepID=UPI0026048C0D|nr:DUF533 domain-containing protein [uncultured Roseobacter sp.]
MSLMNTVTKMAIGFAMAKGMEAVNRKGGIGAVMEGLTGQGGGGAARAGGMGGLGDLLGQLGGSGAQGGAAGGLGGLLGQLAGGTGGGGAAAGGLGGLSGLLGGLAAARGGAAPGGGGLEALLNQDIPAQEPDEEEIARLMLRAMTQAARADGDIDADEKSKLLDALRDGDPADVQVIQQMLEQPVDPAGLAADTPRGLETQVYTMALNAINPDNQAEAQYLHALAQGLSLQPATVNQIHDGLGAPRIYQ